LLNIIDFSENHIEQAISIAKKNYQNEHKCVKILPKTIEIPDFLPFIKNGLGVSAFDGKTMVGYLCCFGPWENAFGTTNAKGIWSPLHGNGLIECNKNNVFAKMYQEVAKKWVNMGVTSHSITFYAHNTIIQNQLYRYGFGLRCIDAIRSMEEIETKDIKKIKFSELEHGEFQLIYPLGILLSNHLWESPMFLRYKEKNEEEKDGDPNKFAEWQIKEKKRYFVAKDNNKVIAYIKLTDDGENYICEADNIKNICGTYCLTEYRGKGIMQNLLNYTIKTLQNENILLLGVDFESYNPTANGFWLKHFMEYTYSVVRRIDERYINKSKNTASNKR